MRVSVISGALLLLPAAARAEDKTYFAASSQVLAGGGFEGLTVTAIGFETTVGRRLSRFLAIEGSFTALVDIAAYQLPEEGAACSGESTDQFHWATFGVRSRSRFVLASPSV